MNLPKASFTIRVFHMIYCFFSGNSYYSKKCGSGLMFSEISSITMFPITLNKWPDRMMQQCLFFLKYSILASAGWRHFGGSLRCCVGSNSSVSKWWYFRTNSWIQESRDGLRMFSLTICFPFPIPLLSSIRCVEIDWFYISAIKLKDTHSKGQSRSKLCLIQKWRRKGKS